MLGFLHANCEWGESFYQVLIVFLGEGAHQIAIGHHVLEGSPPGGTLVEIDKGS